MFMKYLSNVTTLKMDREKCIGCGMCKIVCPHAVYFVAEGKATIIDKDACMECGACARNCPVDAISVNSGVGCATGLIYGMIGSGGTCCGGKDCSCS
ncbi:MAG: mercury methylation ferredoxin HgcB [Kiritimatiellae bacterium]|nr:mercury methylation ferredoxin HgcB [Kiritimatiellia bacterium]MDD5519560.1 mercury methylation ferredoxin HgcB [Kiritimatiellia bacterium]